MGRGEKVMGIKVGGVNKIQVLQMVEEYVLFLQRSKKKVLRCIGRKIYNYKRLGYYRGGQIQVNRRQEQYLGVIVKEKN